MGFKLSGNFARHAASVVGAVFVTLGVLSAEEGAAIVDSVEVILGAIGVLAGIGGSLYVTLRGDRG